MNQDITNERNENLAKGTHAKLQTGRIEAKKRISYTVLDFQQSWRGDSHQLMLNGRVSFNFRGFGVVVKNRQLQGSTDSAPAKVVPATSANSA